MSAYLLLALGHATVTLILLNEIDTYKRPRLPDHGMTYDSPEDYHLWAWLAEYPG